MYNQVYFFISQNLNLDFVLCKLTIVITCSKIKMTTKKKKKNET